VILLKAKNKVTMKNQRKFWGTTILAWIVFIGIDFLFHASLLEALWQEEIEIIKPTKDLFILIPVGYLSFFLLTVLVGYSFTKIYQEKPKSKEVVSFLLIFGLLYSTSNLFGLFSYVNIPLRHLIIFNIVYFIEISTVVFIFYKAFYRKKLNKIIWYSLLAFFLLIIIGIIIQNII